MGDNSEHGAAGGVTEIGAETTARDAETALTERRGTKLGAKLTLFFVIAKSVKKGAKIGIVSEHRPIRRRADYMVPVQPHHRQNVPVDVESIGTQVQQTA